jgi:subtilisin family serine protease
MKKTLLNLPAIVLIATGIGVSGNASAQVKVSQRDRAAILQTQANPTAATRLRAAKIVDNNVAVLLTIDENTSIEALEAEGLVIDGRIGNHLYGTAPINNLDNLAATNGVKSFSLSRARRLKNDKARTSGYVDKVQSGDGLTKAYTGNGVVVGITDSGLDPNHIAFLDSDSNHRVKRLWYYKSENGNPTAYTDETISSFSTDDNLESHGTHVLATAAGSCYITDSGSDYHGVAPDADIAIGCGLLYDNCIIDGAKKIIDYAKEVGKPVVINMSLGDNVGPHDGSDDFTASLNELAAEAPIILASGNEADEKCAITTTFASSNTPVKTVITAGNDAYYYYSSYGAKYNTQGVGDIDIWSDDATPIKVYLDVITKTNSSVPLYSLELTEAGAYVGNGTSYKYWLTGKPTSGTTFDSYYTDGFMGGYTEVNKANGRYHAAVTVLLNPKSTGSSYVAIRIEGTEGHKVFIYGEPGETVFASNSYSGYTAGSDNGSISNMACGPNTISIGAYITRGTTANVGKLCDFSSWGELYDGRVLPDIVAPGSNIYSALNSKLSRTYQSYYERVATTTVGSTKYYWTAMEGTSMATPFATGVVALLLEANPNLTVEEIRSALTETATPMTTNGSGAGKVNALEAIKKVENSSSALYTVLTPTHDVTIASEGNNTWNIYAPNEETVTISVNAVSGASVKQIVANNDYMLDLNDLPTGIYIITVDGAKTRNCTKVVVK